MSIRVGVCVTVACLLVASAGAADPGLETSVPVAAPSRLDWTFVLSNQSVVDPPDDWTRKSRAGDVRYDRFLPPVRRGGRLPLILFIPAGNEPAGWKSLEPVCRKLGIAFASPAEAGNDIPLPHRVQVVLDVLDDLRRHAPIDPDQTYLAGFSGGGRVACAITFALPELVGGVLPVCAGGELRDEPWLRHRAIDRLSVALLTGTNDFNRGEVERFRGPMWSEMGIRTRVWTVDGLGHAIPDSATFQSAVEWLQAGLAERRKFAQKYPASHWPVDRSLNRRDLAQALLAEGEARLKQPTTLFRGLMQLQGVMIRWSDLPAGESARKILVEYEARSDRPWEAADVAEQRTFLLARARALTAYATGPLSSQYERQRPAMARAARELWQQLHDDTPDPAIAKEARERLESLEPLVED